MLLNGDEPARRALVHGIQHTYTTIQQPAAERQTASCCLLFSCGLGRMALRHCALHLNGSHLTTQEVLRLDRLYVASALWDGDA